MTTKAIPCMFMRGGTSRGPYFNLNDLPATIEERDQFLLAVMGSPDVAVSSGAVRCEATRRRQRLGHIACLIIARVLTVLGIGVMASRQRRRQDEAAAVRNGCSVQLVERDCDGP